MTQCALICQNVCKQSTLRVNNNNALHNMIPVVDMTIKLCPSTNSITTTYRSELHVCKQQHTSFIGFS